MQKLVLKIEGMTCGSCSNAITARLSKFEFTDEVVINHEDGSGNLLLSDPYDENREKVVKAINQIGYKVIE